MVNISNQQNPGSINNNLGVAPLTELSGSEKEVSTQQGGKLSFAHNVTKLLTSSVHSLSLVVKKVIQSAQEDFPRIIKQEERDSSPKPLGGRVNQAPGMSNITSNAFKNLEINQEKREQEVELEPAGHLRSLSTNGRALKGEAVIRGSGDNPKINVLKNKLDQLKGELALMEGVDESTLEKIDDNGTLNAVVEESKLLLKEAKEELKDTVKLRNELRENIIEMRRNEGGVREKFELYKNKIKNLEGYTQEQGLAEAIDKRYDKEAGKLIPTLIRLSDELKAEKQKEREDLLRNPDTLYSLKNQQKVVKLKEEIKLLDDYQMSPQELVKAKRESLGNAIKKTEKEIDGLIKSDEKAKTELANASAGALEAKLGKALDELTSLPGQKSASTKKILHLFSKMGEIEVKTEQEQSVINEAKLKLINLLREKATRGKQPAMDALAKLIADEDPVMFSNLSSKERGQYINSQTFITRLSGTLGNVSVRSWADKDVLGPRTEFKKLDGRHADAFKKFGESYEKLASEIINLRGISGDENKTVQNLVAIYKELDAVHAEFVQDEDFANKLIAKGEIAFSPDEFAKISAYRGVVEKLKERVKNEQGVIDKLGNAGLALEGYLTEPIRGILSSLDRLPK